MGCGAGALALRPLRLRAHNPDFKRLEFVCGGTPSMACDDICVAALGHRRIAHGVLVEPEISNREFGLDLPDLLPTGRRSQKPRHDNGLVAPGF